jgi:hypothetical protein
MRGCHHDLRGGKGKGVTKAGTGRRERQGKRKGNAERGQLCATNPSNMVTSLTRPLVLTPSQLSPVTLLFAQVMMRANLISFHCLQPPLALLSSFHSIQFHKCLHSTHPRGFFFPEHVYIRCTATCHGPRGSRPRHVPSSRCFRDTALPPLGCYTIRCQSQAQADLNENQNSLGVNCRP